MMRKLMFVVLFLFSSYSYAVPEIPNTSINNIAVTTMINGQMVILYNPNICRKVGPLICAMYRAHEYGHVKLGHPIKHTHPVKAEFEADCWAAQNISPQLMKAAYDHFMEQGTTGSWSHGAGYQRAKRMTACAALKRNRPTLQ